MAAEGVSRHRPEWPDKALFSAILLVLAGFVGAAFELTRPFMEVDQDRLPSLFTDDLPFYTLTLSLGTLASGLLSWRYQAALFAYVGALAGLLSLGVFGLVPALSLVSIGFMVKSHLEGEETRFDRVQVHSSQWPDKAMAASLFLVVSASIALTQAILILADRFDPIVWPSDAWAGGLGIAAALVGFAAGHQVYHLRRAWLGWTAALLGLATLGFYLIGPLMALCALLFLALAHREQEFLLHGVPADGSPAPGRGRGRRRRPATG